MIQEKVKICDVCEKRIAEYKCTFCEKDTCSECTKFMEGAGASYEKIRLTEYPPDNDNYLPICKTCTRDYYFNLKAHSKEFLLEFVKLIKKYATAEEL